MLLPSGSIFHYFHSESSFEGEGARKGGRQTENKRLDAPTNGVRAHSIAYGNGKFIKQSEPKESSPGNQAITKGKRLWQCQSIHLECHTTKES